MTLSGKGFDYSGEGRTPRAIVQFNPGADGCVLEGFELTGAHNGSHNGAGVRINNVADVVVRACDIHGNDMGIMSAGEGAKNQRIERCTIHHNGDEDEPGYNHNLYLGGDSVTLSGCEVHSSLTGHNVKSRAHFTRVEYSFIHDSANREFDLVDGDETAAPDSHAVLIGNLIAKARDMEGNKTVIHFGQDGGGRHDGTLYLVHNTIVTPYRSPVADLTDGKAHLVGNIIACDADGPTLVNGKLTGERNWLSRGYDATGLTDTIAGDKPPFDEKYRPAGAAIDAGPKKLEVPGSDDPPLKWQYGPGGLVERKVKKRPDLGAFER